MAIDPVTAGIEVGGALLSGLFGGNAGELPPEQQRLYRMILKAYRDTMQYAKGIPGSDPQEQAALAQAKGLAGEGIANQRQGLLSMLGPGGANASGAADALGNFNSAAAGNLAGIDANFLLQFLQNRQNLRYGGAQGMLNGALGAASGPRVNASPDFGSLIGQLSQQIAYQRAQGGAGASAPITGQSINPPPWQMWAGYKLPEPDYSD